MYVVFYTSIFAVLYRSCRPIITFRVNRRRREMYIGHACLCGCLSLAAFPHYCTDPDVTWRNGRGCPVFVHYWADLQSMHWLPWYDNMAPNAKCPRVLVLALCLVHHFVHSRNSYRMQNFGFAPCTSLQAWCVGLMVKSKPKMRGIVSLDVSDHSGVTVPSIFDSWFLGM